MTRSLILLTAEVIMKHFALALLVASAAVAAPVPKNPSPELKWKFAKGDTFYVTSTLDAAAAINGGPGNVQQSLTASVYTYKATVTAADDMGSTLEVEFLSCKTGSGVAGAAVKMADQAGVAGKKLTLALDPTNKVTKADGVADLGNVGGMLGGEFMQGQMQDLLRAVPGKTLTKGDTWNGEEEQAMGQEMVMKRTDRGTVAGTDDGLTKLEVETDNAMSGGPKGGPALDLKGEKGKRVVLFDAKAGRVRKVEENYTVAGNLDLGNGGGGGAPPAINVTLTFKMTTTVSDKEPKEEK